MHESRIKLGMSMLDCLYALSEGNPGAVLVLMQLIKRAPEIDPDAALGALAPIFNLDTHGIYGSRIWCLYKDVCRQDVVNVIGLLRAVGLGHLSYDSLRRAIDGDRGEVNVAKELAYVRSVLSQFAAEVA